MNVDRLADLAVELVARVRTQDPDDNGRWLEQNTDPRDRFAMLFLLAAAVPCRTGEQPRWLRLTEWVMGDPDYVDEIAVERACRGEPISLTRAERYAAIDKLRRRGVSARQISAMLGVSYRTVERRRSA